MTISHAGEVLHGARFEIAPLRRVVDGGLVRVGFRVDAFARVAPGAGPLFPGSPECERSHAQLEQVVRDAISDVTPGSDVRVEVEPWARALVEGRTGEEEVRVRVHVDHAGGELTRSSDAAEQRVLDRITQALCTRGLRG